MNNYDYFEYCKNHPEDLLDPYYAKNAVVIPATASVHNELTTKNEKLIELITAFGVMLSYGKTLTDSTVLKIVEDIISIMDNTANINYSAFSQFFMVYNSSYSVYKSLKHNDKRILVYEMLKHYCAERHNMYLSHGYTNSILQVMCDNYSHKRNSKTGINKVLDMLSPYSLHHLESSSGFKSDDSWYILPDKGDEALFEKFLTSFGLKMESRKFEQNKRPDIVFKKHNQFYIMELKTMKEGGGGQNKQVVEFALFIKYSETDSRFHYATFLDSIYSNILFVDKSPKVVAQRNDIIAALKKNPSNYFLNTKGLEKFLKDNL